MLFLQISGKSKDAQPSSAFLQFAKSNAILCTKITRTRAIICFVEIGRRTDGGVYELNRKFNCNATAMMQFLRDPNDVTGKEHRTLADVVGFSGPLIVVRVWMLHTEAFHLPNRRVLDCLSRNSVCRFVHLALLGIWNLDLGIWDFQCADHH